MLVKCRFIGDVSKMSVCRIGDVMSAMLVKCRFIGDVSKMSVHRRCSKM